MSAAQSEVELDKVKRVDNKEFVDFITKKDDNTIKIIRHKITELDDITPLLSQHFKNIDTLLCLDFHGVADLFDEPIPSKLPKCIISYIGGNMKTIQNTIDNITPRILSNEIILGIIVYTKKKEPICGTKGWILSLISTNVKKIHFIDDDMTNVQCVNNYTESIGKQDEIISYFIRKPSKQKPIPPKVVIEKILEKI